MSNRETDLVEAGVFSSGEFARAAVEVLQTAGIPAFVPLEHARFKLVVHYMFSVPVQVARRDLAAAQQILADLESTAAEPVTDDELERQALATPQDSE